MNRNYFCTVCGVQGNTDDVKAPCVHGFRCQQMGYEKRSRASKTAKLAVWNPEVGVTKTTQGSPR